MISWSSAGAHLDSRKSHQVISHRLIQLHQVCHCQRLSKRSAERLTLRRPFRPALQQRFDLLQCHSYPR